MALIEACVGQLVVHTKTSAVYTLLELLLGEMPDGTWRAHCLFQNLESGRRYVRTVRNFADKFTLVGGEEIELQDEDPLA